MNEKADANHNHKVDILELYNYVRDNVEKYTGGKQTPVFRGALATNIEF